MAPEQVLVVGQDQARAHRQADRGVDPFDDAFADQYVALDDRTFIYDFSVFYQDVFVHVRIGKKELYQFGMQVPREVYRGGKEYEF